MAVQKTTEFASPRHPVAEKKHFREQIAVKVRFNPPGQTCGHVKLGGARLLR
eukprot:m.166180 g.166180  ORF g.166180 m.166180 type:complete len:52 (+) comp17750_c0_seq2:786-941(+)